MVNGKLGIEQILALCMEHWRGEGIELASPVGEVEIRRFWELRCQRVSHDVLKLYSTIGGFQEYVWTNDFQFTLWPWQYLIEWSDGWHGEGIAFCDHYLETETWVLRYENEAISSVWFRWGEPAVPSLQAFLKQYLDDPWELLVGIN